MSLSTWLILVAFISFGRVMSANITVDDASQLWTYSGSWHPRGPFDSCPPCTANPDPSQVFNQTWHDTSSDDSATASITFKGVSVSVYAILTWHIAPCVEHFTFSLNGIGSTPFIFANPNPPEIYSYNILIFSASSLDPNADTNLTVGIVGSGNMSLTSTLLLDYMDYDDGSSASTSAPQATSSTTKSPFPVAVVVVPAVIISLLLAVIVYFLWKRSRNKEADLTLPVAYPQTSTVTYPSGVPPELVTTPVIRPQPLTPSQTNSQLQGTLSSPVQLLRRGSSAGHDSIMPPSYYDFAS